MLTTMLDYIRFALYATIILVALFLFQEWQKEHAHSVAQPVTIKNDNYIPQIQAIEQKTAVEGTQPIQANPTTAVASAHLIHVKTDVLDVTIDTLGGNIIATQLLKYPAELNSNIPFTLLNDNAATRYLAQSGLLSRSGPDTPAGQALYKTAETNYVLADNQNHLDVVLSWENADGIQILKTYTFKRNDYAIDLNYQITNHSKQAWDGHLYLQLMRTNTPPATTHGMMNLATYFGAALSSPEKRFQKISFKEMNKENLSQTISGGWAAMIQHYFITAWVPEKTDSSTYFTRVTHDDLYTIGLIGPSLSVAPAGTTHAKAKLYAGPSISDRLEQVAPGLKLTIDYGWFWFISAIIFWMMQKIYDVIGNWGWSIVLVTVIIKILFYQLSAKSYRSMSAMKKLQPKINALKERFGDDKQKFTQATLELYKKEKVNPMSGCLPILVQIPVFIGLYWVLIESVQLRQAPFILWIHDLSSKDPFYILPILMGLSMFLQQRLNPPPPDPMQAKVMMFMPIIFTFLFLNFPAGLMLYWLVNNVLSFLQQWTIMRSLDKTTKAKKA